MKQYDSPEIVKKLFSEDILKKFEIYSYRNAATILSNGFPLEFSNVVGALKQLKITQKMIRFPGGGKGLIAKYVENLLPEPIWVEMRITADLLVRLERAKKRGSVYKEYVRRGFWMAIESTLCQARSHWILNGTAKIKPLIGTFMLFQLSTMPVQSMLELF